MEKVELPVELPEVESLKINHSKHEVDKKMGAIMTCVESKGFHNGEAVEDGSGLEGEVGSVYQASRTTTLPILDTERLAHLMIFPESPTCKTVMKAEDEWPVATQACEAVNTQNAKAKFWKIPETNGYSESMAASSKTDQKGAYQFHISNGPHSVDGIVKGSNYTVNLGKNFYFCKQWLDNPTSFKEHFGSTTTIHPKIIMKFLYTDKPKRKCRFCRKELSYGTFENVVGAMALAHKRFKLLFEAGGLSIKTSPKRLADDDSIFEDMEADITEKESYEFVRTFAIVQNEGGGSNPTIRDNLKTTAQPNNIIEGLI